MSTVLALEDVRLHRGGAAVLQELSLSIADGEAVALVGPSGAGKSTVIRVLLGLLAPQAGIVRIGGRVASEDSRIRIPPEERGLSVVFQDLALWPHLTVAQNLRFVLHRLGLSRRQESERIERMLGRVELSGARDRYPGELSGGEQQRVALARALVTAPAALLLDEPLANLDLALRSDILELLASLVGGGQTTTLYVTHDPREAAHLTRRVVVIEQGRVVQEGEPQALRAAPATRFVKRVFEAG